MFQSISCHYASGDCYYVDIRDSTQRIVADEIEDMMKRRIGSNDIKLDLAVSVIVCV